MEPYVCRVRDDFSGTRTELSVGEGVRAISPSILVTENIGTCIGLGFYQPASGKGSLYHIAGSEEESLDAVSEIAEGEVARLGSGLYAVFAHGLSFVSSGGQKELREARKEALKRLRKHEHDFSEFDRYICEVSGQYISKLTLNLRDGTSFAKKRTLPAEVAARYERMAEQHGTAFLESLRRQY